MSTKRKAEDETESTSFSTGDRVVDREADRDDQNTAVVVELPEEPAYAYEIVEIDGHPTVADLNDGYDPHDAVVVVAFEDPLKNAFGADIWEFADPDALAQICEDRDVATYAYVRGRLRPAGGDE